MKGFETASSSVWVDLVLHLELRVGIDPFDCHVELHETAESSPLDP